MRLFRIDYPAEGHGVEGAPRRIRAAVGLLMPFPRLLVEVTKHTCRDHLMCRTRVLTLPSKWSDLLALPASAVESSVKKHARRRGRESVAR